jgi:hypothetical protein
MVRIGGRLATPWGLVPPCRREACRPQALAMAPTMQDAPARGVFSARRLLALGAIGSSLGPACDALHNQVLEEEESTVPEAQRVHARTQYIAGGARPEPIISA